MTSALDTARQWLADADGRVLFLLGAGASKPSLPVSAELTAIVTSSLDDAFKSFAPESRVPQLWEDVRPVVISMGTNIEDVYQAVETLTYQESDPTRYWVTQFTEFPSYAGTRQELADDAGVILHMVERHTLSALDEAQRTAPLDHFEPLLRARKVGIVTLNYDQLLERAGASCGVPVSTGAEQWDGSTRWNFERGAQPLLKLHGSMTWRNSKSLNHESGNLVPAMGFYEVTSLDDAAPNRLLTPTDWLDETELLVVVGYSFHDQHVDAAISRWASLNPNRRIVVIDPYPRRDIPQDDGVLGGLLWAMDADYGSPDWGTSSAAKSIGLNRMIFIAEGVELGLPALLA